MVRQGSEKANSAWRVGKSENLQKLAKFDAVSPRKEAKI
ncbi:hypothetical protein CAMRE0001_2550 [Campylobacter rectus RM3267]|uniref:Uncharacterized protein n=1 Tax=Campylobacter rectus RM3267 TaxID=553218 RepID=B9D3T6_CAMRE|nr:hypothetical protein CAMRE0001_2550 [Campylobacter rectus RM3267]